MEERELTEYGVLRSESGERTFSIDIKCYTK